MMTDHSSSRDWHGLVKRHRAFWNCEEVDRPLIGLTYRYFVDTEVVAATLNDGELQPHMVDPRPILAEYDKVAAARGHVGDDIIPVADAMFGIPWLEAICGSRVMVADGKSIWPEPPENSATIDRIEWSEEGAWFQKLLEITRAVVDHAFGRYAVGISHLRGPADVLIALLGAERLFLTFFDDADLVRRLAGQAATAWLQAAQAQAKIVPPYRGGYGLRFYGLWAPERTVWLQDDTSVMMSLDHYQEFFLSPMRTMSVFPCGTLHLHIPSLHIAETLARLPNLHALNLTFDSQEITLQRAMPTLRRLQDRRVPLILTKDTYAGFSLDEYDEILENLSPRGLSVHLKADSVAEGRAVMAYVKS
jgi:hypothetical protein